MKVGPIVLETTHKEALNLPSMGKKAYQDQESSRGKNLKRKTCQLMLALMQK